MQATDLKNTDTISLWRAYLLVFISSSCGLIVELVASRLMAPYVGTSLYTWTSVIGVTLAGISLGNWLGGRLADQQASFTLLRRLYFLAAFTNLAIIPLVNPIMANGLLIGLPTQLRVLISSIALFMIPSTIFGTISPVVIKLTLKDLATAGNKVGSIYAVSTVGSIAGTFLTGFYLVSIFGTRAIVLGVGILMVITTLALCTFFIGQAVLERQTLIEVGALTTLFGVAVTALLFTGVLSGGCLEESDYYCIRVYEQQSQNGLPSKALVLDHLVHNFIIPGNEKEVGYGYERVYADVASWMNAQNNKIDLLVIGAGAFSFPRYIRANYPNSTVDALEIDPKVVEVTRRYLGLKDDPGIAIYTEDARVFLNRTAPKGKYSLVQGDAFQDITVPYHLTTHEFAQTLKASMQPDGIYMLNTVDSGTNGRYLRASVQTLRKSFQNVVVYIPAPDALTGSYRSTYVILATNRAMTTPPPTQWQLVPAATLQAYLDKEPVLVLTDDFVPVDNLLLPVVDRQFALEK